MLVQAVQLPESSGAEITAVVVAVPCCTGGNVVLLRSLIRVVPTDLLVGEDVVPVDFAAVLVYFLPIDAGGAGAGFEMETDAGEVGEFLRTPGTFDVFPNVDGGLEMLHDP